MPGGDRTGLHFGDAARGSNKRRLERCGAMRVPLANRAPQRRARSPPPPSTRLARTRPRTATRARAGTTARPHTHTQLAGRRRPKAGGGRDLAHIWEVGGGPALAGEDRCALLRPPYCALIADRQPERSLLNLLRRIAPVAAGRPARRAAARGGPPRRRRRHRRRPVQVRGREIAPCRTLLRLLTTYCD